MGAPGVATAAAVATGVLQFWSSVTNQRATAGLYGPPAACEDAWCWNDTALWVGAAGHSPTCRLAGRHGATLPERADNWLLRLLPMPNAFTVGDMGKPSALSSGTHLPTAMNAIGPCLLLLKLLV